MLRISTATHLNTAFGFSSLCEPQFGKQPQLCSGGQEIAVTWAAIAHGTSPSIPCSPQSGRWSVQDGAQYGLSNSFTVSTRFHSF